MKNEIIERIDDLEEKIESLKWFISQSQLTAKPRSSAVRRSCGILGKKIPEGTIFENKIRRGWSSNFGKRTKSL